VARCADAYAALAAGLLEDSLVVRDEFLSLTRVSELRACAEARRDRGEFRGARVGAGGALKRREDVRGDHICWLSEPLFDAERSLCGELEELRCAINAAGFLGLFDLELHYASYPPGASYARHVDRPLGRDQRLVSVVVYLNDSWQPSDGGELRVFEDEGHRDIEPLAGRLVCFLTAGREHAVLATRSARLSLTGWLSGRGSV
jgi:SM-20-related protein